MGYGVKAWWLEKRGGEGEGGKYRDRLHRGRLEICGLGKKKKGGLGVVTISSTTLFSLFGRKGKKEGQSSEGKEKI